MSAPPDRADRVVVAILDILEECGGVADDARGYIAAMLRDEFSDAVRQARDDIKNPE